MRSTSSWSTTRRCRTCRSSRPTTSPRTPASRSTTPCCRRTRCGRRSARSSPPRPATTTSRRCRTTRVPTYANNKWLTPMDEGVVDAEGFDQDDILAPMAESLTVDDKIYGEPFYGEGSFLMYRTDIFDKAGVEMPEKPDLGRGLEARGEGRRCGEGHEGHLPARPARLGRDVRPADDRGQHLRRHVVRRGLERPGRLEGVQGSDELLRRPHQGPRRIRCPAGRLHRMPDEPAAGQGRHVVRLDGRHRHPRSR
jgi:hypothetical protein